MEGDVLHEQLRLFPDVATPQERKAQHISPHQPMGGGPPGTTCGGCIHLKRHEWAGTYFKCAIWTTGSTVKGGWGGQRRKKDPACPKYEAQGADDAGGRPAPAHTDAE